MIQNIKKPLYCGFFCLLMTVNVSIGQISSGLYAVYYTDKPECESIIRSPEQFLSARSIARRAKHHSNISCTDVPVNTVYIHSTQKLASSAVIVSSKWLNAAVFNISSESSYLSIRALPFVDSLQLIAHPDTAVATLKSVKAAKYESELTADATSLSSSSAIHFIGADYLNRIGYFGENVIVAVLDGGFISADISPAFNPIFVDNRVVQVHDFVSPVSAIFHSTVHGTAVWGLIGGVGMDMPIGAASKASYCLYRTEDVVHESKLEEFYWAAAMERADSVGADAVNSSLGYNEFDDSLTNYSYANFEGAKSIVSRIAKMAWERGIFVVNSAGNEGRRPWHYTMFPAEVPEIMSVGSVDAWSNSSYFTSESYPESTCIKPEVAALGEAVVTVTADGSIGVIGNGTSFAAPAISGGAACLIGAFPDATNDEIKSAIVQSSSLYSQPNSLSGYGVADFRKAFLILQNSQIKQTGDFVIFPNPAHDDASVMYCGEPHGYATVEVTNPLGELVYRREINESGAIEEIILPLREMGAGRGIYSVSVRTSDWCTVMPLVVE